MFIIALTGGIGSGKSTVADELARLGAGVIDTDVLARELTEPGQPTLDDLVMAFGPGILTPDGELDRAALRARVFADAAERHTLEAILHPRIRALMHERLATLEAPYGVLVIPLLFETNQHHDVDRVLVVDTTESLQIARVQERSGLSADEIERIMSSQVSRAERLAGADDVIENNADRPTLMRDVRRMHDQYLKQAAADRSKNLPTPRVDGLQR